MGVNKEKRRPMSLRISHMNEDKVVPSPQRRTRCSLPGRGEANRGGDPSAASHQHWGPQLQDKVRELHGAWRPTPTSRASKLAAPFFPPPKPYAFLLCPSLTKNYTRGCVRKGFWELQFQFSKMGTVQSHQKRKLRFPTSTSM